MLGAICGDIVGSIREFAAIKSTDFDLIAPECSWTDDTVMTVAVAEALMSGGSVEDSMVEWVHRHYDAGYGPHFLKWASDPGRIPYGSWGNGAAMRVSPAAWLSGSIADAAASAARTAAPTHDHHHGIRGAKATAVAVRMALEGWPKEDIGSVLEDRFGYDLSRSPDDIRPGYDFEVSCQKSVPESLCCLLAAGSYEESVRLCVSLGGDADTMCAVAGAAAEPMFGIPEAISSRCLETLTPRMVDVHAEFRARTSAMQYPRTDPGALPRDRAPPEGRPDPTAREALDAMEATQAAVAELAASYSRPRARLLRMLVL